MRTVTLLENQQRGSVTQTVTEVTPADWLLVNGRAIHGLLRDGFDLFDVAREMGIGSKVAALAVAFSHAPDGFKLCALTEVKGMVQIRDELINLYTNPV